MALSSGRQLLLRAIVLMGCGASLSGIEGCAQGNWTVMEYPGGSVRGFAEVEPDPYCQLAVGTPDAQDSVLTTTRFLLPDGTVLAFREISTSYLLKHGRISGRNFQAEPGELENFDPECVYSVRMSSAETDASNSGSMSMRNSMSYRRRGPRPAIKSGSLPDLAARLVKSVEWVFVIRRSASTGRGSYPSGVDTTSEVSLLRSALPQPARSSGGFTRGARARVGGERTARITKGCRSNWHRNTWMAIGVT